MNIDKNVKYILSNDVRFRREKHRCIFYTVDDFFFAPDNIAIIHPNDVIFLLLFDGTRAIEDIERDYKFLFNIECDVLKAIDLLSKQLPNVDFLVPVNTYSTDEIKIINSRFNPEEYLIPSNEIFLNPKDLRLDSPLSVNFNVATKCGFSCIYCYHPLNEIKDYISLDRLELFFKDLKAQGCESILLTGGDPMLRPDIDDMMILLHQSGLFYTLSTKSILSKDRIKKLHDNAGLDRIQLSIDSFDPEIEKKLIGVDSTYVDKFINMVMDMKAIGLDLRFKAVLTRYNADIIDKYLDKCEELEIKHIQIVSYGRSGYRHTDDLFPSDEQFKNASSIVEEWRHKHPEVTLVGGNYGPSFTEHKEENADSLNDMMKNRVVCNAGRFSLLILPNGEAFICEHLPYKKEFVIGDLKKQSLYEIWNGEGIRKWLSSPSRDIFPPNSPCKNCKDEYYNYCHSVYSRCLRFSREYMHSVYAPDYHCPKAVYDSIRIN